MYVTGNMYVYVKVHSGWCDHLNIWNAFTNTGTAVGFLVTDSCNGLYLNESLKIDICIHNYVQKYELSKLDLCRYV